VASHSHGLCASRSAAAGVVALLVATFSYQPLHPLVAAFPGRDNKLMSNTVDPMPPDSARELSFAIENAGAGTAKVRSVRVVGRDVRLLDIAGYEAPLAGTRLARGSRYAGRVYLSKATCATDEARLHMPTATVDALVVRVEALGFVRTQRLDVDPPADLFCGWAAFNR
jgi:hypothetical protein